MVGVLSHTLKRGRIREGLVRPIEWITLQSGQKCGTSGTPGAKPL